MQFSGFFEKVSEAFGLPRGDFDLMIWSNAKHCMRQLALREIVVIAAPSFNASYAIEKNNQQFGV